MKRRAWTKNAALGALLVLGALAFPRPARAQSLDLSDLLLDFLRQGITLARPAVGKDHSAHFTGDDSPQIIALGQVNSSIADQLSSFPVTSSAGGFSYEFDSALGVFTRRTKSFGPIYTERALSIGRGKFNLGVNYSEFTFDHLDDLNLRNGSMDLVFVHADVDHDGNHYVNFVEGDLVTARIFVDVKTKIRALVATYGVNDRLDFGIAVPSVEVEMRAFADATVQHIATRDTLADAHRFPNGTDHETFQRNGSATGLGDVRLRGKLALAQEADRAVALTIEARLPTGDEANLLGSGAFQGKAGVIGSAAWQDLAAHVNAGYAVTAKDKPDELSYAAGFDWAVDPRLTLVADLLGRRLSGVGVTRVEDKTYDANTRPTGPPNIVYATFPRLTFDGGASRNTLEGSVGFKMNFAGNFLLTANGLFSLTRTGLRDAFTPLVGLDYSF